MTAELQASLNRLAGTDTLDAQAAANVAAGTTGMDLVGALNVIAGTWGVEFNGVCRLIGVLYGPDSGSDAQGALDAVEELEGINALLLEDGGDIETEAGDALVGE